MSVYVIPALASLIFKLAVLVFATKKGGKISIVFLSLIVVFALHNALELIGYVRFFNGENVESLFRLYYVATIYLVLYVLLHGLTVSRLDNKYNMAGLVAFATILSALVLFSDLVVAGSYSIEYSVTAAKGSYYWVFVVYILSILLCNFAALIYGYKSAASQLDSIRCLYSLFALTPVMLTFFIAAIFKVADIGVNAAGFGPIATALFLLIVLKSESKHKLSDVRRLLPFSLERKTATNLISFIDDYTNGDIQNNSKAYKTLRENIEKEIIFYSLSKCDNNISQTSKMMGLENRSTLYSMMDRLGIDIKQIKQAVRD